MIVKSPVVCAFKGRVIWYNICVICYVSTFRTRTKQHDLAHKWIGHAIASRVLVSVGSALHLLKIKAHQK